MLKIRRGPSSGTHKMLTTPHLEAVPHGLAQGRVHVGDDGRGGYPQALGRLSHGRRQLLRLNSGYTIS